MELWYSCEESANGSCSCVPKDGHMAECCSKRDQGSRDAGISTLNMSSIIDPIVGRQDPEP